MVAKWLVVRHLQGLHLPSSRQQHFPRGRQKAPGHGGELRVSVSLSFHIYYTKSCVCFTGRLSQVHLVVQLVGKTFGEVVHSPDAFPAKRCQSTEMNWAQ